MNIEEVERLPPSKRGLTPELERDLEILKNLRVEQVVKVEIEGKEPEKVKSKILGLTRRLKPQLYKTCIRDSAVYVVRLEDLEEENKEEEPKEEE